ncbi:MAG: IclR family transcriptional regulator [Chloroflexota bacterium]
MSAGIAEARTNHTLEKGLDILGLFTPDQPELSVAEIQQRLDIPQSTLYRLLRSMKAKGWIEDDAGGHYRLGLRILELARVVRRRLDIAELARTIMIELSKSTGETILLTCVSGQRAICIERVEGPQAVRVSMERGAVLPLHAGASSTVLLAYLDEPRREEILSSGPLRRYTENTITDPEQVRRRLERIRLDGYAFTDHEVDPGVRAIAAPILDRDRCPMAALSLVAPSGRLPDARIPEVAHEVKVAAERLGELARDG